MLTLFRRKLGWLDSNCRPLLLLWVAAGISLKFFELLCALSACSHLLCERFGGWLMLRTFSTCKQITGPSSFPELPIHSSAALTLLKPIISLLCPVAPWLLCEVEWPCRAWTGIYPQAKNPTTTNFTQISSPFSSVSFPLSSAYLWPHS